MTHLLRMVQSGELQIPLPPRSGGWVGVRADSGTIRSASESMSSLSLWPLPGRKTLPCCAGKEILSRLGACESAGQTQSPRSPLCRWRHDCSWYHEGERLSMAADSPSRFSADTTVDRFGSVASFADCRPERSRI